ncbi:MAG TPA: M56 family metallopeptidase, partial [Pirellulales bacterium]|nr:M56 family metallopeptidase [Pirellulales bacterium]
MSDFAIEFLPTLGRTTVWLILAGLTTAAILRLARATWPTAHRIGWVVTLLVGWTFLRLPVVIPWYDATARRAGLVAEIVAAPQATFGPIEIPSPLAGKGGDGHRREALVGEPGEGALAPPNSISPFDVGPGKAFPGLVEIPKTSNWLGSRFDWPLAAVLIWALGVVGLAAAWLVGYLRFVRSLPSGLPAEQAWLDQWNQLLAATGGRRTIPVRVTADLGPMLCRLPRGYELLVPADLWRELEIGQRGAILRHELAHFRRGDVWKSLVVRMLALPHWFNPVSWWA